MSSRFYASMARKTIKEAREEVRRKREKEEPAKQDEDPAAKIRKQNEDVEEAARETRDEIFRYMFGIKEKEDE